LPYLLGLRKGGGLGKRLRDVDNTIHDFIILLAVRNIRSLVRDFPAILEVAANRLCAPDISRSVPEDGNNVVKTRGKGR